MSDEPKEVSVINAEELVRRIEQAKALRGEGAPPEEIAQVEPTEAEMREVLLALRRDRSAINTAATKRSASRKPQPKTLDGLLGDL